MRHSSTGLAGLLAALLVGLLATPAAAGAAGGSSGGAAAPTASSDTPAPVLLIGVGALDWRDVDAQTTPTLWGLAGERSVASMTVKSVRRTTCLVDGWLTLSAGRRAADDVPTWCRPVPRPVRAGAPATAEAAVQPVRVPDWAALVDRQDAYPYGAELGLLGDTLAAAGTCATAAGPGAAIALARSDGRVDRYVPGAAQVDADLLGQCPVTVVDAGWLPSTDAPDERAAQAVRVDQLVGELIGAAPQGTAVLVGGISDSGPTARIEGVDTDGDPLDGESSGEPAEEAPDPNVDAPILSPDNPPPFPPPGLRLAAAAGPALDGEDYGPRWLTSASTRWTGMVQLTDLTPTLLAYAGVPAPPALVGLPWRPGEEHPGGAATTVEELVGADVAAQVFRTQSGFFFQALGGVQIALALLAAVLWRVRPTSRAVVRRWTYRGALLFAAFPVASFLANLSRWWLTDRPTLPLWLAIAAFAALVVALAAAGPWRRRCYGPPAVVALVTVGVMTADAATGSNLQHSSLLGLSPLVAGRFYGFGNIPYSIYAATALVLAGALAQYLLDQGRSRRVAAAVAASVGLAATLADGTVGADFGGMLALVPAVAVLVLGILGRSPSWGSAVAIGGAAVAVVAAVAVADWLRPPAERSHLGDFVQDVIDGDAVTIVLRKGGASLSTLDRPYGLLAVVALVLLVLLLRRPGSLGLRALPVTYEVWPVLQPTIWALVTVAVVGFAVNDSGVIIPALVLTQGIPLVVAALARATDRAG